MNSKSKLFKELSQNELELIIFDYLKKEVKFNAKLISGGMFNTTYHLKIENSSDLILRVGPTNKNLILKFELNLMNSELLFYNKCISNSIPCSNVLKINTKNNLINRDYMLVEYIHSKPLSEIKLDKNAEKIIYKETGQYLKKLHNIKGPKFGRLYDVMDGKGYSSWSDFLYFEICKLSEKAISFNVFTLKEIELFKYIIEKYKKVLDEITIKSLVHGDFWTGNILVEKKETNYKIAAIIDGDRALYGDSAFDLANNWISHPAFFTGYNNSKNKTPNYIIRKKIYCLIYNIIDTYVWNIEYNDLNCAQNTKKHTFEILKDLLSYHEILNYK